MLPWQDEFQHNVSSLVVDVTVLRNAAAENGFDLFYFQNIVIERLREKVIRNVETSRNGRIFGSKREYVAYTGDVLMLGQSVKAITEVVTELQEAAVSNGLVINEDKTKCTK